MRCANVLLDQCARFFVDHEERRANSANEYPAKFWHHNDGEGEAAWPFSGYLRLGEHDPCILVPLSPLPFAKPSKPRIIWGPQDPIDRRSGSWASYSIRISVVPLRR